MQIIKCSFKIIQNEFVNFNFVLILVPIFLRKRKKIRNIKIECNDWKKKLLWK